MTIKYPKLSDIQRETQDAKKEKEKRDKAKIDSYISEAMSMIPEAAKNGLNAIYIDDEILEKFITKLNVVELRTYYDIVEVMRVKINNESEFFAYHNINGLCISWSKDSSKRKEELKKKREETSTPKNEARKKQETPKKQSFLKRLAKHLTGNYNDQNRDF